jgi:hypothetical protein
VVQSFIPFSTTVVKQCLLTWSRVVVVKQRAVTEFLIAENVTPTEIHRRLQAVYGETLLTELQ